jgi:hypothetical protein
MRVPEEPVCIDIFRQNPVFTSLHLKYPVHVVLPQSRGCFYLLHRKISNNISDDTHWLNLGLSLYVFEQKNLKILIHHPKNDGMVTKHFLFMGDMRMCRISEQGCPRNSANTEFCIICIFGSSTTSTSTVANR